MNRKEFEDAMGPMCKALGVKMNKFQAELYWIEFKNKHQKDFAAACLFCGRGQPGKLPFQSTFGDAITAANEMRSQKEKDNQEKQPMSGRINFTLDERLKANRAAFEISRQARMKEPFDVEKVKAAWDDETKDEEIRAKYGEETPNPAMIFGNIGRG